MRFMRPVLAQYYRRGKSFGRRDFSVSRGHQKDDVIADVMKMGERVMWSFIRHGVGLALGTGTGYVIVGNKAAEDAEEMEQYWMYLQKT